MKGRETKLLFVIFIFCWFFTKHLFSFFQIMFCLFFSWLRIGLPLASWGTVGPSSGGS